jgi:hypothetical protein
MEKNILTRYWIAYGGIKALISSIYFWISVVLSLILFPLWSVNGWWDTTLSVMPNLLGFSLGGYAMWIAIGDEKFRRIISSDDDSGNPSPFMEVNAAFVHFILLQAASIILALIAKAISQETPPNIPRLIFFCMSHFIFIYAILSAVAAALGLFRVSSWYDEYLRRSTDS